MWFGDDAAAVAMPGPGPSVAPSPHASLLLLATDAVVAGIDADLSLTSLSDLGWKAMAVNLSDIAAMGGTAAYALVSVIGAGLDELDQLYAGILEAAATYSCPVVGGDLSAGTELAVSVAVAGWVSGPPVLRSGARPGDTIWVTGRLGAAAAGLRLLREAGSSRPTGPDRWSGREADLIRAHARPTPALGAGAQARAAGATAMIDVSDGLVTDIAQLAELSGVGFELVDIPLAPGATLDEGLGGGDDYVLAFTVSPAPALPAYGPKSSGPSTLSEETGPAEAFVRAGLPAPHLIGKCLPDPTERLLSGRRLEITGWEHSL